MNKVVKKMLELSETDKFRKNKKIKWDMFYLHMGYINPREVKSSKSKN
tara:strand:- start:1420 stop:1563 length:144 start_codon:yes stop_codon:yes gene_type:complete